MTDIASLTLAIDSTQSDKAQKSLDKLTSSAKKTEDASSALTKSWSNEQKAINERAKSIMAADVLADQQADKAWALANGYTQVGNEIVKASDVSVGAMSKLGLNTQYARREMMQLGKEAITGDFGRMPNAFASLATHSNLLPAMISPIGIAIAGVTAVAAAGVYAWYNWGESAKEASAKASKAAKEAEKDANAAWAGVSVSLEAQIAELQGKMQGAWGQLDAAKSRRASITRETDAAVAQSIGSEVQARRKEIEGYQRQIDALQVQLSQVQEKEKETRQKKIEDQNKIAEANAKEYAHAQAMARITDIEISNGEQLTNSQKKLVELLTQQEQGTLKLADAEFARQAANLSTMATSEMAMVEYIKKQKDAEKAAKEAAKNSDKAWETFADNTQRTMSDVFYNGLTGKFQDIEQAFKDMIMRMLANAAAASISKALFGDGTKSGSGSSGWLGALAGMISFDGGGSTGQGMRTGGVDGKGGFPAIVHPNETVIDNTKGQSGGGGVTIVDQTTINIDSRADRQQVLSDVTRLIEGKQAQLVDRLSREGKLA